jgi:hypothetical protein
VLLIDDVSLAALDGSRPADQLIVWAWYDGALAWPEALQVESWQISGTSNPSTKVQQQLSLKIADPHGALSPWLFNDPLGVGGVELQVMYRIGGASVINRGRFRVESNSPQESFVKHTIAEYGYMEPDSENEAHKRDVLVSGGAVVDVTAVDLTSNVDRDKFLAPESPQGTAPTVLGEFRRLMADHFPVVVEAGVGDTAAAKTLVYDKERLEAGQDLLASVNARYRMGGDGECRVYPIAPGPVVWRVQPMAGLVSVSRGQDISGLYNYWVVEGKEASTGRPVAAVSSIETGPLRVNGPHGRVPDFYSSEQITSVSEALAYANTLRDRQLNKLAVELKVETTPRPEIQAGDRIEVGCPVAAGHVMYLPGEVTDIQSSGSPVPGPTQMTVSCSYADVVRGLSTTPWMDNLTGQLPELTWDRMPTSWGRTPDLTWNDLP